MKSYRVTLSPLEPYFFGNEKGFAYPKGDKADRKTSQFSNQYFIRSENVPSQSTLLGALRYLFLPVKLENWGYTDEQKKLNSEVVGELGFDPAHNRTFGRIINISPVFLQSCNDILVPAPFDHTLKEKKYTPFKMYDTVETPDGKRYYTKEYDSKKGIVKGYLNLKDGTIIKDSKIFSSEVRVGINRASDKKGFFKKEYCILNENYSFGFYVTLKDDLIPENTIVYLGQGKSAFAISFIEEENKLSDSIRPRLKKGVVYCLGDTFAPADIYSKCLFAITKIKTYRAFSRNGSKVRKESVLYRLISAGSVFIPEDTNEFVSRINNENVNCIGYNEIVINNGGEE